jgi:hypothetical protein
MTTSGEPDLNELNERHRRRLALMRAQGGINKLEDRAQLALIIAAALGGVAAILMVLS